MEEHTKRPSDGLITTDNCGIINKRREVGGGEKVDGREKGECRWGGGVCEKRE